MILTYSAEVFPHYCLFISISAIFTGNRGSNGHFVDAESVRKILKIYNLRTANAILMKFSTIMYLHESVNRKALS